MKKLTQAALILTLIFSAASCGNSNKTDSKALEAKKAELQKLKDSKTKTDDKIKALEAELAKSDTGMNKQQKPFLVSVTAISAGDFTHYLDLQGKVDAQNISYITPRGMGGQVKALYVQKGDVVKKGQLLLQLDNALASQNVATVKQSMGTVQAQLGLAQSIYARQKNLWDQHIGTEVQLLQAKTNVETLQNQLKSIQENVKSAQEQLNQANVYSNVSGVADEVNIHVGETFTGAPMNGIKIVNTSDLKVVIDIPEAYQSRIKKETPVEISIPDVNKTIHSRISLISQSISSTSRGFTAEAKIPYDPLIKPNQIALIKILDYNATAAIAVPINTLETDESGKYILVAVKEGDKMFARKRRVQIGEAYGDKVEIKDGLKAGDSVITEGFQGLYDGQLITTH